MTEKKTKSKYSTVRFQFGPGSVAIYIYTGQSSSRMYLVTSHRQSLLCHISHIPSSLSRNLYLYVCTSSPALIEPGPVLSRDAQYFLLQPQQVSTLAPSPLLRALPLLRQLDFKLFDSELGFFDFELSFAFRRVSSVTLFSSSTAISRSLWPTLSHGVLFQPEAESSPLLQDFRQLSI